MQRSEIRAPAVLAIVLVSYTMIVLDISIVITALPKIHYGLGFSATALSWVQNAYVLTFGGLLLLGARAGDVIGRRRMLIIGLGVFTLASIAAAGGVTNVAHQIGGSLGLAVLVAVFAAAGSRTLHGTALLAHRISAALPSPRCCSPSRS